MLVRLVTSYRRGEALLLPGETLEAEEAEAQFLIEEGVAVPVTDRDLAGVERR